MDEILRVTPADDTCDSVLESELANILGQFFINPFSLESKSITHLHSGDFEGLTRLTLLDLTRNDLTELQLGIFSGLTNLSGLDLDHNSLATLPSGVFSGLVKLTRLELDNNSLATLPSDVFSGLTNLERIFLHDNPLRELPAGVFSGLTNLVRIHLHDNQLRGLPPGLFSGLTAISRLQLEGNPGAPFRFTVRFEPKRLDKDFTVASARLVLREGAPRPVTVPLSATGASLSVNSLPITSLTLTGGSTQSDVITITRAAGAELFELNQGELELGEHKTGTLTTDYTGFEIVRGPPLTTATATRMRIKVFLEGALE